MKSLSETSEYVFGSNEAEYQRLMKQAKTFAACTERLFRDAGVGSGQRVLDVGSGVGDVALLAASLIGETGSVLGIDRDATALRKARSRARALHAGNIQFLESDLSQLRIEGDFDAIVGRFILMFLPNPAATLLSLAAHLRPGGVIVFHEVSWSSLYPLIEHLPLRRACADLICSALRRSGARPDMPLCLYQGLREGGYREANIKVEVLTASDAGGQDWLPELMASLRPRFDELGMHTEAVGEFATLAVRLEIERENARSFAPLIGLVGAWARKAQ